MSLHLYNYNVMDPVTAGAAIGAGAGALDSVVNLVTGNSITKSNRAYAEQQWNKTNAYNSPLEQRKRMEAAGFNPNMMYGSGTVANTASPATNVEQVVPPKPDIGASTTAGLKMGADVSLRREQSENANIQNEYWRVMTDKVRQDAILSGVNTMKGMTDLEKRQFENSHLGEMFDANLDAINANTRLNQLRGDSAVLDNKIKDINLSFLPVEKERQARFDIARIGNILQDTNLKGSLMKLQGISGDKLRQEIENLKSSKVGNDLENLVRQMRAFKSKYGITGNGVFSEVSGVGLKMIDDFIGLFGGSLDKK